MTSPDDSGFTGVQLIIAELLEPPIFGRLPRLLDIADEPWIVEQTALAWAEVRGLEVLASAIDRTVPPPPDTGFAAVINKRHRLIVYSRWHWAGTNIMAEFHLI